MVYYKSKDGKTIIHTSKFVGLSMIIAGFVFLFNPEIMGGFEIQNDKNEIFSIIVIVAGFIDLFIVAPLLGKYAKKLKEKDEQFN